MKSETAARRAAGSCSIFSGFTWALMQIGIVP
jgi:hypothetical protein